MNEKNTFYNSGEKLPWVEYCSGLLALDLSTSLLKSQVGTENSHRGSGVHGCPPPFKILVVKHFLAHD